MAYGVKYRLEFSDDLENGKKIEILKKNYTSSTVLDIVGGAEPCIITWQGDDNFYSPIKGSQCTLNFFVTDDVSYDNFYEYDEREYQVKISYKDSSNNYQLFWIGWLVTDQFKEAITTKPFPITLKAIDGLGTLDSFDMTLYQDSYSAITARQWITSTLANLDLEKWLSKSKASLEDVISKNNGALNSLSSLEVWIDYIRQLQLLDASGLSKFAAKFEVTNNYETIIDSYRSVVFNQIARNILITDDSLGTFSAFTHQNL